MLPAISRDKALMRRIGHTAHALTIIETEAYLGTPQLSRSRSPSSRGRCGDVYSTRCDARVGLRRELGPGKINGV
jgi:hypothetical protein